MKKGWQRKRLGEITDVQSGGTPLVSNKAYWHGDIPWYSSGELNNLYTSAPEQHISQTGLGNSNAKLFPAGSLLIGMYDTAALKMSLLDRAGAFNQAIAGVKPNDQVDLVFVLHAIDAIREKVLGQRRGVRQKNLSLGKIRDIELSLPPLPEQQRIGGILDEAFEGIATAKANAEKNLQNVRALFESHLQAVFTQHGEGWVEKKLGDDNLLEIIDGDRGVNYPKASDFYDEGHCLFLNTKNVRPDGFDFESKMFITAEKDAQLRKGNLKRDDVVLTTRGTIGNIGLYSEDIPFDNIRINSGMLIFRPNKHALLPSFLFELLRSEIVKDQIRKQTTGAAQPQLPIKTLVNFVIPVPMNLEDQRALVKKLRAFEPETQRLESIYQQKLAALEELKKSLLHQAFTGQLTMDK